MGKKMIKQSKFSDYILINSPGKGFPYDELHDHLNIWRRKYRAKNESALAAVIMKFLGLFYSRLMLLKYEHDLTLKPDATVDVVLNRKKGFRYNLCKDDLVEGDDISFEDTILDIFTRFVLPDIKRINKELRVKSTHFMLENVLFAFYFILYRKGYEDGNEILRKIDFTRIGLDEKYNNITYKTKFHKHLRETFLLRRVCCQKAMLRKKIGKCFACPIKECK
jgi:ferric iron reductase protein FhuF